MLYKNLKLSYYCILLLLLTGCEVPIVTDEPRYLVLVDDDITYAEGLSHNTSSTKPFAVPLKLDVYYPNNDSTNRPVFMFIHGGGFTGGSKTKPEIVDMASYYASRGWVFVSIDYRTAEELVTIPGMSQEELFAFADLSFKRNGKIEEGFFRRSVA